MEPAEAEPVIEFPLRGTWLVVNPPGHPRHAYDLSGIGSGGRILSVPVWRFLLGLAGAEHVVGWGRPVHSPVDGEVARAVDGIPDRLRLNPIVDVPASMLVRPARARGDLRMLAGNHVVIRFGRLFALLAHFRQGTVAVATGDQVVVGQRLGEVGNSGNTLGPHLHFHVMDSLDFASARVVSFRVRAFEVLRDRRWAGVEHGRLPGRIGRVRVAGSGRVANAEP